MAVRIPSVGVLTIAQCYFSAFVDSRRVWKWWRFIILGICPMALSVAVAFQFGAPTLQALGVIIPVYSVLIAVLVGTIPLAHSVIGQSDPERIYDPGERSYAKNEIDRIQALQDILASISYAAIFLVISLVSCIILAFLLPPQNTWISSLGDWTGPVLQWSQKLISIIIYVGGTSSFFTFFDMSVGVFDAMENHAETLKKRIRQNVKQN